MERLIVRRATAEDLSAIVWMGRQFYDTTHYAAFAPYCDESAAELVQLMSVVLVAEVNGELVGMVGLIVSPFPFNKDMTSAHEVMWWVHPEAQGMGVGRALIEAVEPACREAGASVVQMTHLANSPVAAGKLYEKMGYTLCESSYSKILD